MMIKRYISDKILSDLKNSGKVVVLYGPRQSGKTTLSKRFLNSSGINALQVNADQLKYIDILSSRNLTKLRALIEGYDYLFIDEGQRIPEIGLNLKIIHDELPNVKVLVTGSSSFLLSKKVTESLAGRKRVFTLLPISMQELSSQFNSYELDDQLAERLVFGSYPEVITTKGQMNKISYLQDIASSYIYKDILELENIRYPMKVRDLLRLLSYQVGSQVSIHELSKQLRINSQTVERYLELLEHSFVIYKLPAFSRNLRKEISKSSKYYFYDNGIRNILIDDMKEIEIRDDIGALWENFIITERKKKLLSEGIYANSFFWRTYTGAELDYIEERGGNLFAYEIKYKKSNIKTPVTWREQYASECELVNRDNYLDFIT